MQKIATTVFIYASLTFGVLGVLNVLTMPASDAARTPFNILIMKLLMLTVFIILPSFALSVAGKYLHSKS